MNLFSHVISTARRNPRYLLFYVAPWRFLDLRSRNLSWACRRM